MTLLIFDCDGVLVDSEHLACEALAELMTTLGHSMTADQAMIAFAGRSLKDVLARAERLLPRPIPEDMGERAARQLMARFRRELKAVAGVKDAIAALPHRRCVASSSAPDRLMLSLDVTGLSPLFGNNVFSAVEVANGKPAPDLVILAARRLGEEASSCVVIEDSVSASKPLVLPAWPRSVSWAPATQTRNSPSALPTREPTLSSIPWQICRQQSSNWSHADSCDTQPADCTERRSELGCDKRRTNVTADAIGHGLLGPR